MAELLILVVIAGVVLLYAVDRARKLRARARQMSGMNERLDVAAAKVDEQQERKQARVRASAELTSVLPAIKRPPLTLPGAPGPATEPEGGATTADPEDPAAAAAPEAGPAAEPEAGAVESPAAQAAPDSAETPATTERSATGNSPEAADEASGPVPTPEGTLTMGRVIPEVRPALEPQVTSDATMIMPSVPSQGPAPADETALPPAPAPARPRASRPRTGQPSRTSQPRAGQASRAGQARTSQPGSGQPRSAQSRTSQPRSGQPRSGQQSSGQQSTSPEQANRD